MRKLTLRIESLEVETFETAADDADARGTVQGASGICPVSDNPADCPHDTEMTGPCCDHTLMLSCVQTGCDECFTAYETCWC